MKQFPFVSLLIGMVAVALVTGSINREGFVKTGDCEDSERACVYDYTVNGGLHNQKTKEEVEIKAQVTLHCQNVGKFSGENAKYYCITMEEVSMKYYEIMSATGKKTLKDSFKFEKNSRLIKGKFCFVRNSDGKVLKTFYPPKDPLDIVNLKKSITSALQANFAKTSTQTEEDVESVHTAHYSYQKKGKNTVEHKTVNSNDVSRFSGKVDKRNVEYNLEEDITVDENNIITKSHGTTRTSLSKENKYEERPMNNDADIPPVETKSEFTLKKIRCLSAFMMEYYSVPDIATEWEYEPVTDSLMAKVDEREGDLNKMEELHNDLPDLPEIAKRSVRDTTSEESSNEDPAGQALAKWKHMLALESKHGPQGGRKPKLEKILNELKRVSTDHSDHSVNLRLMIYNLLSSEGSLSAQQALMRSLRQKQMIDDEYDSIIMAFTLLQSIDRSTLLSYKDYVLANMMNDDQLLLSLGTLGRHKNVEHDVVNTIVQLIKAEEVLNDTETMIYFIHALGNTGSKLIIPHLVPLAQDSTNMDIQLVAIDALRTVSMDKKVQMMFNDLVTNHDTAPVETTLAIMESLRFPYESYLYYPMVPDQPEDEDTETALLMNLINSTIHSSNTALHNSAVKYLRALKTDFSDQLLNELSQQQSVLHPSNSTKRLRKRYTSNWGSTAKTEYNLVASPSSRNSDIKKYSYHKALLWGTRLGPSKIHASLAVGGFGGVGLTGYKVFGRGVVQFYCFGRTYTFIDAVYLNQYGFFTRQAVARQYVKLLGTTYAPRVATTAAGVRLPYTKEWSKNFYTLRLFQLQYSIFVYVGTLTLTVKGDFDLDGFLTVSMKTTEALGEVRLRPSITITGGVEANIGIFKAGFQVSGNIGYYIAPRATIGVCKVLKKATPCHSAQKLDASACFGIFHGSKGLRVNIQAYWQRRTCNWRFQCSWTDKSYVNALSTTFSQLGISERMLWGKCLGCNCNGLFNKVCQLVGKQEEEKEGEELLASTSSCSCRAMNYFK